MPFLVVALATLGIALLYLLVRPVVAGAPYFTTEKSAVETILRLSGARPGERVADLGSGDGRLLVAFAKAGCRSQGYEINPLLVLVSRLAIGRAKLGENASVEWKSFWSSDLSEFDIVVLYGFPRIMEKLQSKLLAELKPGARIISNQYRLPTLRPVAEEYHVRLYIIPPANVHALHT